MEMKVLYFDSDIPSIYFPVGLPETGGTCAFATKKCLAYCPSGNSRNKSEIYALTYFKENDASTIAAKVVEDYKTLIKRPYHAKMIQWFVWGDCLPELTEKVYQVIMSLNNLGIPQYGFTRNRKLWELVPAKRDLNMGYSLDSLKKAMELSYGKMTACPDYQRGYARMIFKGHIRTSCNGWWCITETGEERNSDCNICLQNGEGCYSEAKEA
ncbi:hypothetical protein LCGC14_0985010 [marine sediment metagenome]|uniref:Uncharacterized protein n=1 Tax=marine sediment metagenome TaxID=412755 RepID=A0A0F9QQT1_9ZZZZ